MMGALHAGDMAKSTELQKHPEFKSRSRAELKRFPRRKR
jgi:hypothetical protein